MTDESYLEVSFVAYFKALSSHQLLDVREKSENRYSL
jgi:hypothetical protein